MTSETTNNTPTNFKEVVDYIFNLVDVRESRDGFEQEDAEIGIGQKSINFGNAFIAEVGGIDNFQHINRFGRDEVFSLLMNQDLKTAHDKLVTSFFANKIAFLELLDDRLHRAYSGDYVNLMSSMNSRNYSENEAFAAFKLLVGDVTQAESTDEPSRERRSLIINLMCEIYNHIHLFYMIRKSM